MATLILSYPAPSITAALRASRSELPDPSPLQQWLTLCDHLTRAGARILVLDPAPDEAGTDLVFASHLGAMFNSPKQPGGPVFLLGRPDPDRPPAVSSHLQGFLERAGLAVRTPPAPWAGQADLLSLDRNRFILTTGPGSAAAAQDQVRELLPPGARVLDLQLAEGWPYGNTALSHVVTSGGDHVLLCYSGAFTDPGFSAAERVSRFCAGEADIVPLQAEDGQALGATSLAIRGTIFVPVGLSTSLRGTLVRRGFQVVELDLPALMRCGTGLAAERRGLRALVNELPGYVLSAEAPSYALRREELHRLLQRGGA